MLESFVSLFFLGIAAFLSPCCIALISVYLTYALGSSKGVRKGLVIGASFAAAMCLVFFFLGYAVSSLIPIGLANYRTFFFLISGVLLTLFGINNLGLLKKAGVTTSIGSFLTERTNSLKFNAMSRFSGYNYAMSSFLFGGIISLALGPCSLSLVLPAILFTMFTAPTPFHGGLLLLAFGFGEALPVIFLSAMLGTARQAISDKFANSGDRLKKVFGAIFVVAGIVVIAYVLGGW